MMHEIKSGTRDGIRAQSSNIVCTRIYSIRRHGMGTGEVERSMRKDCVKNLNLSWVFEGCMKSDSN